jgi:hypothetical protein
LPEGVVYSLRLFEGAAEPILNTYSVVKIPMKNPKHAVSGLLSAVLLLAGSQVFAQAATIGDCQAIQDRLARYACYDSWDAASGTVRRSAPAPRNTETTSAPRAETQVATESQPAPAAADDFGRQSSARLVEGEDGDSELIDTIASLEQLGPSLWLITLDGGQQWRQMISKRYALQEGDEVRIYSTRWGSAYRLAVERVGGYIQVERVDAAGAGSAPTGSRIAPPSGEEPREEEGPSLLGRIGGAVGGIFDRDSAEEEPEASDGKSELIDTVAALEERGPGLWLITLEGGQQWQQMISKRYALQVGEEIRIYPTRWGGSYRLASERIGGFIQVERVD